MIKKQTRVLVVDDSALMRKHLSGILLDSGEFEVATARDGLDALAQLAEINPDVITLDINMPGLDGLNTLSRIMTEFPRPVIMVSSLTAKGAAATLEAMALGAVDFIEKPGGTVSKNIHEISTALIEKVRSAAMAHISAKHSQRERMQTGRRKAEVRVSLSADGLVLIGVSTGGPGALDELLPLLSGSFPWPIVVAQHMPASFTAALADRLNKISELSICEVSRRLPLQAGTCYIGRGGSDVIIGRHAGVATVSTVPLDPSRLWHPSVERMVETAALAYEPNKLVGVLLTGMGDDGATAMANIHKKGARTIAESEESATIFGMPKELIARGGAQLVLPIGAIADQLENWLHPIATSAASKAWGR